MPEEFVGQDLSGAVFWGVDLSNAHLRDVNLTGATLRNAWLIGVDIDALVDRLTINGVDVTDFVNQHDPWYPLRGMLRPSDPQAMGDTWRALEHEWATTIDRASQLEPAQQHESVAGEWSFVDTLRHLVFGIDKWFSVPILGDTQFHPLGRPNSGSVGFGWPGLTLDADATFTEALAARAERAQRFGEFVGNVTAAELEREVDVLENGTVPIKECVYTVFEEAFEHNRYALRDLAHFA